MKTEFPRGVGKRGGEGEIGRGERRSFGDNTQPNAVTTRMLLLDMGVSRFLFHSLWGVE